MAEVKEMEKLPEGWKRVRFGGIAEFFVGSSKSRYVNEYGRYTIIDMGAISPDGKLITHKKIDFAVDLLRYGDLVMPKDDIGGGNIIGKAAFIDSNNKYVLGDHVFRIKIKEGNTKYFYYFINSNYFNIRIRRIVTGTAQLGMKEKEVKKLDVIFPRNLKEQHKIAEILETVDNAIEKTDRIIEKYKRIKKGLMQDLLTKGIDENGQIRSEETHRFKDSPLGRIPEEWEVVRLGNKIYLEYGTGLIEGRRKQGDYPVFGSNGIVGYHNEFLIKGPGIIVGRKGTIGAVKWSDKNFWAIDTTYYVRRLNNDTDLRWLYYKLISLNLPKLNMATGTPGLNRDLAYSQFIYFPPLPEQHRIASILSQIDETIEKEQRYKEKLERIKQGLMEDLLTGKVRVNHLIEGVENVS